jgi:ABC-2 type transport system ATP-binding protein
VVAVDGIDFAVGAGEIFGLLGPNGAGKTTTMEILEGLTSPDGGEVRVLGMDPTRQASAIKARIGVQLQTAALYPQLTVVELVELFGSFYPRHVPVDGLLAELDLDEKRNAQTKTLSGGQRQRLSVALALVNDPELVFLDEPTTGLDPAARRSLWQLIRGLQDQGRSVLMTTHYLEEAETLCDRVAIMDGGRIIALDSPQALIDGLRGRSRVIFEADGLDDDTLAALAGVQRVTSADGVYELTSMEPQRTLLGLVALAEARGVELRGLSVRQPTLEDVFLDATGTEFRE